MHQRSRGDGWWVMGDGWWVERGGSAWVRCACGGFATSCWNSTARVERMNTRRWPLASTYQYSKRYYFHMNAPANRIHGLGNLKISHLQFVRRCLMIVSFSIATFSRPSKLNIVINHLMGTEAINYVQDQYIVLSWGRRERWSSRSRRRSDSAHAHNTKNQRSLHLTFDWLRSLFFCCCNFVILWFCNFSEGKCLDRSDIRGVHFKTRCTSTLLTPGDVHGGRIVSQREQRGHTRDNELHFCRLLDWVAEMHY